MNTQDIRYWGTLGHGNGGTVFSAYHVPSEKTLVVKVIVLGITLELQKQIMSELEILSKCDLPYIIGFYGALFLVKKQKQDFSVYRIHGWDNLWMYVEKLQSMSLEGLQ